jgi:proteasome lid subunit RPN8/RPN11
MIIIHNHPGGGRLSYADIKLLFKNNRYSSMFAIGHNGDLCGIIKNGDISIDYIEKMYKKF